MLSGSIAAQSTESAQRAAPAASQPTPPGDEAKLPAARRFRDAMIDAADFNAALNPALAAVAAQAKTPDPGYANDLNALARIEAEVGQYDKAEADYLKTIDIVQAAEGEYSLSLVIPYRGLGRSYIKSDRFPEAITALEQAQHISQRNLGLFNVEQAPLLDDITTAYLGIGDTSEARRIQLERLDNAVKRFGVGDPRVIPYRYQLADYYQRSRLPVSAREQYQEVLVTQESQLGPGHPGLMDPLRQLVRLDLLTAQTEKKEAHAQLISVLENNPDTDAVERGLSLATLGDWAIVANDPVTARDYYKRAWDAMRAKPDFDVAGTFAKPQMIDFIAPLDSVDRNLRSKPYTWAEIDFAFDVSAEGRPLNVQQLRPNGGQPTILESRYSLRVRETHFRPRLVDGEPVATGNVQFTHYFRVYVDVKKGEPATPANGG